MSAAKQQRPAQPPRREPAKFLFPSEIRFFARVKNWSELASERRLRSVDLTEYARRLMSHDSRYPKLQVVQLGSAWYALNSLQLAICRHLEKAGHCRRIRVLVCPQQQLPGGLGRELSRPDGDDPEASDSEEDGASSDISATGDTSEVDDDEEEEEEEEDSSCSGFSDCSEDAGNSDCSGSDSYCSECEGEDGVGGTGRGGGVGGGGGQEAGQSGSRRLRRGANESAAAGAAGVPREFDDSQRHALIVDRDLADLGPTALQLLERLRMTSTAIPPPAPPQPLASMSKAAAACLEEDAPESQNLL